VSENSVETAEGKTAAIRFDGSLCIHARRCVLTQPNVFKANVQGPWIDPDAANPEALLQVALNCPSGAIHVERHDGGPNETAPLVNTIAIRENGPIAVNAEIVLAGAPIGMRATLCRCGESKNKPYCDGSHVAAGFTATGEPATAESAPLARRDGPLAIALYPNGPLGVAGPVEIITGTGRTVNRVERTALCRCGHSERKPYCDGAHAKVGFVAP
jgi:CDGSH-type Zn-finger protein/uncharacterized Fe-S cluster protein YjdI